MVFEVPRAPWREETPTVGAAREADLAPADLPKAGPRYDPPLAFAQREKDTRDPRRGAARRNADDTDQGPVPRWPRAPRPPAAGFRPARAAVPDRQTEW